MTEDDFASKLLSWTVVSFKLKILIKSFSGQGSLGSHNILVFCNTYTISYSFPLLGLIQKIGSLIFLFYIKIIRLWQILSLRIWSVVNWQQICFIFMVCFFLASGLTFQTICSGLRGRHLSSLKMHCHANQWWRITSLNGGKCFWDHQKERSIPWRRKLLGRSSNTGWKSRRGITVSVDM